MDISILIRVTDTQAERHHTGRAGRRQVRSYTSKYGVRLWLGTLRTIK